MNEDAVVAGLARAVARLQLALSQTEAQVETLQRNEADLETDPARNKEWLDEHMSKEDEDG